jgi:hypothetical protein
MDLVESVERADPFGDRMVHETVPERPPPRVDTDPARKLSVSPRIMAYIIPPDRARRDFPNRAARTGPGRVGR